MRRGRSSAGVDVQPPPADLAVVEASDRLGRFARLRELHEGETARPPGLAIGGQVYVHDASGFTEQRRQLLFRGAEVEIAYKDLRRNGSSFRANSPSA